MQVVLYKNICLCVYDYDIIRKASYNFFNTLSIIYTKFV